MTNMLGKGIWRFKGRVFGLYSCFFLPKKKKTTSFLRKKKKKEAVTHPSLPSLTKAEMDNNVVSSFQHSHFLPPESEKKRRL